MKFHKTLAILSMTIFMSACSGSKQSNEIVPTYVSPVKYQNYTCQQLMSEFLFIDERKTELENAVNEKRKKASNANVAAGLFFWPALFLVKGNEEEAKKYALIKGEYEAVKSIYQQKRCTKASIKKGLYQITSLNIF